jgi:hypothetical protein
VVPGYKQLISSSTSNWVHPQTVITVVDVREVCKLILCESNCSCGTLNRGSGAEAGERESMELNLPYLEKSAIHRPV